MTVRRFLASSGVLVCFSAFAVAQDANDLVQRGRELMVRGQLAEAEALLRQATELAPDASRPYYYLGVVRLRQGRAEEALPVLERARSLAATPNPAVLYELGTAYAQSKRFGEAERVLRLARELAPNEARIRVQLAWVYYQLVDGENAETELRAAIEREPDNAVAHFYLALTEAALGKSTSAIASFQRAIALDALPPTPSIELDARLGLAHLYSRGGEDARAREQLETVLSRSQGDPSRVASAHNELGLIALRDGETAEAARHFEAVLDADPRHRQAIYNLSLLYRRLDRDGDAAAMSERLATLSTEPETRSLSRTESKPPERR